MPVPPPRDGRKNVRKCVLCHGGIDLDSEDAEYEPDLGWCHEECLDEERGVSHTW